MLAKSPGFTAAAVVCLGIGIGVTAGAFSSLQSTVFRAIPGVRDPDGLVRFQTPMPYADWEEIQSRTGQFSTVTAFRGPVPFVIAPPSGEPERIWGHVTAPNYFETLGTQPALGSLFGLEARPGAAVAVIGHGLWRRRFGGDASVVGRSIRMNGRLVTILGVAPEGFSGASPYLAAAEIWIPASAPAAIAPELAGLRQSRAPVFDVTGRLVPGVTTAQAEAALEPMVRNLEQLHNDPGKDRKERRVLLLPGGRMFPIRNEDLPRTLGLITVLVGVTLLMACGNVATMLVARGAARRREIAVRLSIGASRGRLVRQLVTESVLLSILGGALGLALARWMASSYSSLASYLPGYVRVDWSLDRRAVLFAAAVSVGSAILFGLAPALNATRDDIASALKRSVPPKTRSQRWFNLRNFLVAQQVAASMVLLLLTGFIVLGFSGTTPALGFDYRNLYLFNVDPVRDGYGPERAAAYVEKLQPWLERVPGVTAVSVAQTLPIAFTGGESLVSAKAEMSGGPKALSAIRTDHVGAAFFETAGLPIIRGRGFVSRDVADDSRVMVVNETMAKRVWPGQDPLGQRIEFEGKKLEVIGVAGDIRPPLAFGPVRPAAYRPVTPSGFAAPSQQGVIVMVRVRPGFTGALDALRRELEAFDPNVTVFNSRRMQDDVARVFSLLRIFSIVYGGLGAFALILATIGLAGVTAYSVARRTHEIGIRMALGATRANAVGLVLRESAGVMAVGGVIGFLLALAVMRGLSAMLNVMAETTRTSAYDPRLLLGIPALLAVLAALACFVPARRAAQISPIAALKSE